MPILLTAGTVVIGAFVILFDPIFQGLAISLMGGAIASTALTLLMVPLIFFMAEKHKFATEESLYLNGTSTTDEPTSEVETEESVPETF
jgi:hypothetical protein